MGHIGGDLAQAVHQDRNAVQHPIERAGEPIQIVSGAAHRHAMPEISADNRLGGTGNRVNPSEKGPA